MGRQFVGDGATEMDSGNGLVGKPFVGQDGHTYRRQYRGPSEKPNSSFTETGRQANFETQRLETTTDTRYRQGDTPETVETTKWKTVSDGHADVAD